MPSRSRAQKKLSLYSIPQSKGEISHDVAQASRPPHLVGVKDQSGVRSRTGDTSQRPEVSKQLIAVVHPAVTGNSVAGFGRNQRLALALVFGSGAQLQVSQPYPVTDPMADSVWATVRCCTGHTVQDLSVHRGVIQVINAGYAAHRYPLMARLNCCRLGIFCFPFIRVLLHE
jgi:hypothetical protein